MHLAKAIFVIIDDYIILAIVLHVELINFLAVVVGQVRHVICLSIELSSTATIVVVLVLTHLPVLVLDAIDVDIVWVHHLVIVLAVFHVCIWVVHDLMLLILPAGSSRGSAMQVVQVALYLVVELNVKLLPDDIAHLVDPDVHVLGMWSRLAVRGTASIGSFLLIRSCSPISLLVVTHVHADEAVLLHQILNIIQELSLILTVDIFGIKIPEEVAIRITVAF